MAVAIDLLPDCKECGHEATHHMDRAFVACAVEYAPWVTKEDTIRAKTLGKCHCPGYRNWGAPSVDD